MTIIWTRPICEQAGRYLGWPSIARLRSGALVVVFSGDRDAHVCPWGKTQLIRSRDDGLKWSQPVTINNTPLDDRDAGVIETDRGTLLVSWFTSLAFTEDRHLRWQKIGPSAAECWRRHAEKIPPKTRRRWLGSWVRRSEDGGTSWGAPIRASVSAPHGPIALSDGRLLYVGMRQRDGDPRAIGIVHSLDDGRSWEELGRISIPASESVADYSEPHVAECEDGSLVAMLRYQPADVWQRRLRLCRSVDRGRTWSTAKATDLLGYPPHLLRLGDNRLLVTYGRRLPPYGQRACISVDGGRTWSVGSEFQLAKGPNDDLGYPCSTQLPDGSILTVYYQVHDESDVSPPPKTSLMCTRWRPEPA